MYACVCVCLYLAYHVIIPLTCKQTNIYIYIYTIYIYIYIYLCVYCKVVTFQTPPLDPMVGRIHGLDPGGIQDEAQFRGGPGGFPGLRGARCASDLGARAGGAAACHGGWDGEKFAKPGSSGGVIWRFPKVGIALIIHFDGIFQQKHS